MIFCCNLEFDAWNLLKSATRNPQPELLIFVYLYIMTMTQILLFLLAVFPGLLISYLIYRVDKYEKEPWWQLAICFALGFALVWVAYHAERILGSSAYMMTVDMPGIVFLLLDVFIVVGFTEEILKFAAVRGYIFREKAFNEPMDGIVYTVLVAMGFATAENIMYVMEGGLETGLVRMFTAVPAHGMLAVIMGYFLGIAKFESYDRPRLYFRGIALAVLGHGLYDFFILQQYYPALGVLALVLLVVGYRLSYRLIRLHREDSPFK